MTNREQIAWAIGYSEYEDSEVADMISDMVDAIGCSIYFERDRLTEWLGLECDEYNNWGELEPIEEDEGDE